MPQSGLPSSTSRWSSRLPWSLIALFLPAAFFGLGLLLVVGRPGFDWLAAPARFPWEFWVLLVCGLVATTAGVLDWRYHRTNKVVMSQRERHYELAALAGGGVPLFVLMAVASVLARPQILLLPVLIVVLFTVVLICYDEFIFHRKRCAAYETLLHRLLVFGNGLAWLAWAHWCFVRGGAHG